VQRLTKGHPLLLRLHHHLIFHLELQHRMPRIFSEELRVKIKRTN
jgi:hypothetical protein